jgi:hypothetical protein
MCIPIYSNVAKYFLRAMLNVTNIKNVYYSMLSQTVFIYMIAAYWPRIDYSCYSRSRQRGYGTCFIPVWRRLCPWLFGLHQGATISSHFHADTPNALGRKKTWIQKLKTCCVVAVKDNLKIVTILWF